MEMLEIEEIQSVKHEVSTVLCKLPSCPTEIWNAQSTTLLLGLWAGQAMFEGQVVGKLNGSGTTST